MQPEQVLEHPSCRLNAAERQRYFDDGFVAVPSAISSAWIDRLRHTLAQALEDSRAHSVSDDKFLLEEGHSAERPATASVDKPRRPLCTDVGVHGVPRDDTLWRRT